jgi:hypothetical protein
MSIQINRELKVNKQNGSCGCGAVEFRLNSEIVNVVNCHCNMCRRHNGSSFSTYAVLPFRFLEIIKGQEQIKEYSVGSGKKHFCEKCGTPLFNVNEKYPGACMLYIGTLHLADTLVPKLNVWCESKLAWVDALSDFPGLSQGVEHKNA